MALVWKLENFLAFPSRSGKQKETPVPLGDRYSLDLALVTELLCQASLKTIRNLV